MIYVLGQYSEKYGASFILQVNVKNSSTKRTFNGAVNQPMFLHYCLLQGVKRPREITSSLFAIRKRCAVLKLFVRSKINIFSITLKGEERRSLMRGCRNLRFDYTMQQNFTNRA